MPAWFLLVEPAGLFVVNYQCAMAETPEHLQSDEDVEEILRLAIRKSGGDMDGLRSRLEMSAAELGIGPAELKIAEEEYRRQKQGIYEAEASRELEKTEWKEWRRTRWHDFFQHLGIYVAVNTLLAFIDYRGGERLTWVFWPIVGWGIAVAIQLVSLLASRSAEETEEFRKWQKKRRRRAKV